MKYILELNMSLKNKEEVNLESTQEKIKRFVMDFNKLLESTKCKGLFLKIGDVVIYKNRKYGDSALSPINIFSKINATNSITIRLDDKINRIINAKTLRKNDIADMIGYLILYAVSNNCFKMDKFIVPQIGDNITPIGMDIFRKYVSKGTVELNNVYSYLDNELHMVKTDDSFSFVKIQRIIYCLLLICVHNNWKTFNELKD